MKTFLTFLMAVTFATAQMREMPAAPVKRSDNTHGEMSTLWFQSSGEARALFYQTYALAKLRLDEYLAQPRTGNPPAIVTDVDETVLDNSPYQAWTIHNGRSYPDGWAEWVEKAEATPLPGALEFFRYAATRGVTVFYVTNRNLAERAATVENLKKTGFPFADTVHVLVRTAEGSKENRRKKILERFNIIMLCGDNLNDLAEFSRMNSADRNAKVDLLKQEFGDRLIVLPNPMYGDWEGATYDYQYGISDSLKTIKRRSALKGM